VAGAITDTLTLDVRRDIGERTAHRYLDTDLWGWMTLGEERLLRFLPASELSSQVQEQVIACNAADPADVSVTDDRIRIFAVQVKRSTESAYRICRYLYPDAIGLITSDPDYAVGATSPNRFYTDYNSKVRVWRGTASVSDSVLVCYLEFPTGPVAGILGTVPRDPVVPPQWRWALVTCAVVRAFLKDLRLDAASAHAAELPEFMRPGFGQASEGG
jgi:hypothetical protein